jgi:hypothetical protein
MLAVYQRDSRTEGARVSLFDTSGVTCCALATRSMEDELSAGKDKNRRR